MPNLVSIIIPVYNCARFIAEAVQSALDQDYTAKEVIVVNDGSTDNTIEVLQRFGNRIRLIDQKNGGPPQARNTGLRAARGEYIAFLDSDDIWLQGKLTAQATHLDSHPEVGTVFSAWQEWRPNPDGTFRRPQYFDVTIHDGAVDNGCSGWLYNRLLFDCELLTTTVMLRASTVRSIGEFDVTMFNGDDYDYWIRASRVAQISKLKSIGALYRILPNSIARTPRITNFEYEVIQKALSRWGLTGPDGTTTAPDKMDQRLERLIFNHGYAHLQNGDPQLAFGAFRDILRRHPAKAKLWLYALRAFIKMRVNSTGKI